MLYYGPNEEDYDGDSLDGGGLDGAKISGLDILSQVQQVVIAHWVFGPLMFITLTNDSTCDMQLIRHP